MKKIMFKQLKIATLMLVVLTSFVQLHAQKQKGADIYGNATFDLLGTSVSMPDAHTLAIGVIFYDGTAMDAGAVRIYRWVDTAWVQKGGDIDGEAGGDQSGYSVSMPDSNTVAISAQFNRGGGSNAGHVRIYRWDGSSWVQKGGDIDGEAAGDQSGNSVSMPDANTVAIGALFNDGAGDDAGHVRIYRWNGSSWVQKGGDIDGEASGDQSGYSVSMPDSNTVAIGAVGNNAGYVRIYSWSGSSWIQKGGDIDGEASEDLSGRSVSMPDANTVAIGAPMNDGAGSNAGHVRIYRWAGSTWVQKGVDIDGAASGDQTGTSVSMPDSNTVAIGAPNNDGAESDAGQVRIYSWSGSAWTQQGIDIDGKAKSEMSGRSVSMPDAHTVAIGAPFNTVGGVKMAGHVRVYMFSLCENTTDTVNINTCISYVSPSNKYTYVKSGTYYDTIPNANGCDSIITINLTINSADVSVTNSSPTLTANATDASYQWLDCDNNYSEISNANNQSFLATSNGNYAVEVVQNGCTDTSECINVSNAQILKNTFGTTLKVFPNPTIDAVNIDLGKHYDEVLVILRNAVGQEVMKTSHTKIEALTLQIPGETGLYILELHAAEHKALMKVLKN